MRLSNTLRRQWHGLLAVLGVVALAAIAFQCARELYWAATESGLHTMSHGYVSHSHAWITCEGDPYWFVASVIAYAFGVLFMILLALVAILGWRNERHLFMRWASRPPLDDAIRLDPDSR